MRLLLVEENCEYLEQALTDISPSYLLDQAHNSSEASYLSAANDYDLIIVGSQKDLGFALDICSEARQNNSRSSILLIGESDDVQLSVDAVLAGADFYLARNDVSPKLPVIVKAMLRKNKAIKSDCYNFDAFSLNFLYRSLTHNGNEINLRRKEYDLLEYLVLHKGMTVSRERLLEHVWKEGIYALSNTVEVHIRYLRAKLAAYSSKTYIKTYRNFGYRFDPGS